MSALLPRIRAGGAGHRRHHVWIEALRVQPARVGLQIFAPGDCALGLGGQGQGRQCERKGDGAD